MLPQKVAIGPIPVKPIFSDGNGLYHFLAANS